MPTPPKPVRDWSRGRTALVLGILIVAVAAFGGLVMPRMASDGIPQSLTKGSPDRTVQLARRKTGRLCPHRLRDRAHAESPFLLTPADR